MANTYINVYNGNVTPGGTDGEPVSYDASFSNPIETTLDAAQNESKVVPLAIRTGVGYKAINVVISDSNDSNDRIQLGKTSSIFSNSISFDEINSTNTIFYVRFTSVDTEKPQVDTSVQLKVSCKVLKVV